MSDNKNRLRARDLPVIGYFINNAGILIALAVIVAFFALNSDVFLGSNNIINILRQISMNAILACGMSYCIIVVGVDLSAGSTVAASGCLCVLLLENYKLPLWACILCAMVLGLLIGLTNGCLISFFKLPPYIATLSMSYVVRGLAYCVTGGMPTLTNDEIFNEIGNGHVLGFLPIPIVIMFCVLIVMSFILNKTKYGRKMYAVGGNKQAALFSGININRIVISVYMFSGLMASIAAIIQASRLMSGQPTAGEKMDGDAIASSVLGGVSFAGGEGKIGGMLIGAMIIGIINNGLNLMNVAFYWQYIAKGLVIIVAVTIDIAKKANVFAAWKHQLKTLREKKQAKMQAA